MTKAKVQDQSPKVSISARIQADIARNIISGRWPPGHRIPFERELVTEYRCSRMTVNKALQALVNDGLIHRIRSIGSFVSVPKVERSVLEIQDFQEEADKAGHPYRHEVLMRRVETLEPGAAQALGFGRSRRVLHVTCLHLIDAVPIAYEDRLISLAKVPQAADCRFDEMPPGTWLLRSVPWSEAEHVIRARNASAAMAKRLGIKPQAACLVLERETWHAGALVTYVELTYPGDRHRFAGRFSPVGANGARG
jgi:GntR family histidine utilization transcriptional repressor